MSHFLDDIMKNTCNQEPVEVPEGVAENETAKVPEEPEPVEPKPEEPAAADTPAEPEKPEEKPGPEPRQRPDLSTLTKEEKAQHAFQRQLAKQRDKYENAIKELTEGWNRQFSELKESLKKPEERKALSRDQFDTDDEYIKALADQKVNEVLVARDAKAKEEEAEKARADADAEEARRQNSEQANAFNASCHECFADEAVYGEFSGRVQKAVKNGFAELLDQAPAVRDFIFTQPAGPKVLDAMLRDRNTFVRVMGAAGNPTLATIEMYELAKELEKPAEEPQVQDEPKPPKGMPHIGKPGSRGGSSRTTFKSDNDIINFVRNVH